MHSINLYIINLKPKLAVSVSPLTQQTAPTSFSRQSTLLDGKHKVLKAGQKFHLWMLSPVLIVAQLFTSRNTEKEKNNNNKKEEPCKANSQICNKHLENSTSGFTSLHKKARKESVSKQELWPDFTWVASLKKRKTKKQNWNVMNANFNTLTHPVAASQKISVNKEQFPL